MTKHVSTAKDGTITITITITPAMAAAMKPSSSGKMLLVDGSGQWSEYADVTLAGKALRLACTAGVSTK